MGFRSLKRHLAARLLAAVMISLFISPVTRAAIYPHTQGTVGELLQYKVRENESLIEIARRFDLGYNSIVDANPGVDPFLPRPGTMVTIPTYWIVPAATIRPNIIINLPEYRLYYFSKKPTGTVATFPLGIGDEGTDTPLGSYTVIEKITSPSWHVPGSMRRQGKRLPKVVPPGPGNPLGSHALRLSRGSILIHGTNRPWGIGRRSSHGCLRLYPEDIVPLFGMTQTGMRVLIINQPLKIGSKGDKVLVEVHRYEGEEPTVGEAMHLLFKSNLLFKTDFSKLVQAFAEKKGVPVDVTLAHLPSNRLLESLLLLQRTFLPEYPENLLFISGKLNAFLLHAPLNLLHVFPRG